MKTSNTPVRGVPKSGRRWKVVQKKRSSALKKGPAFNTSWEKKLEIRAEKKAVKEYQDRIIEAKKEEKAKERRRIEQKRKMKEENERKAEVVQVVTNMAKIKRMKRKQRLQLQMRDTSGVETKKM